MNCAKMKTNPLVLATLLLVQLGHAATVAVDSRSGPRDPSVNPGFSHTVEVRSLGASLPAPSIAVTDAAVIEGDTAPTSMVFQVSLSAPSSQLVTVDYATADDTATQRVDYTPVTGRFTFNPGETNKTVTVQVIPDLLPEADETFYVRLSDPTNAVIGDGEGIGAIADNDPVWLSISDTNVVEGDSDTTNAVFMVTLDRASTVEVIAEYATLEGSAKAGVDFLPTNGVVTFRPGETNQTIEVQIVGDRLDEEDKQFSVELSMSLNGLIRDGQGVGTIVDDDLPPTVTIGNATVVEGHQGTTNAVFMVSL